MAPLVYLYYPYVLPGPQTALVGTSTFAPNWLPSGIPDDFDGFVPHVGGFRVEVQGSIVQAAGAGAIRTDDWALLMSTFPGAGSGFAEGRGVRLSAQGELPLQCTYLSAMRIMQSMSEAAGALSDIGACGPPIPASAGGATTAVTLSYGFRFFDERWKDPFAFVKPAQWWSQGNWQFDMADPKAVFGAKFSWSATPTVRLIVDVLLCPDIILSAPFEWREKMNITTAGATTIMQPGIFQTGGFLSPAFGGDSGFCCDDLVSRVLSITNPKFIRRYPVDMTLTDWALHQNMRDAFPLAGLTPFAGNFIGSPVSPIAGNPTLATLQLFGPRFGGHRESIHANEYIDPAQINWVVTLLSGKTLTNQHQYYFGRSLERAGCSPADLGGNVGAVVKQQIADAMPNCGGFGAYVPLAVDGVLPPPSKVNRTTLVSKRR